MSNGCPNSVPTHARSLVFIGLERSPPYILEASKIPNELEEGEVLISVELAAICGSDIHTLVGQRSTPHPCVLGHEGCGVVVRSGRPDVQEGDRVTWGISTICGNCLLCSLGLTNKCENQIKCGQVIIKRAALFGSYSTHIRCPAGTPIVTLPPALTPQMAAPVNCPLATMVHAISRIPSIPRPGQPGASVALIQGAGMMGIYAIALLKEAGFSKVYCIDMNRSRLSRAVEFGATPVHPDQDEEIVSPDSVDVVIEACGNKEVLTQGMRTLRVGGTYILVGLVHKDSKLNVLAQTVVTKCLTLIGVHNYTSQHLEEAVKFLSQHHDRYPFSSLMGPIYPLSEFRNAVEGAKSAHFFRVGISPHM